MFFISSLMPSLGRALAVLVLVPLSVFGFSKQIEEGTPNIGIPAYLAVISSTDSLSSRAMNGDEDALATLMTTALYLDPKTKAEAIGIMAAQTSLIHVLDLMAANSTRELTLNYSKGLIHQVMERKKKVIEIAAGLKK